MKQVTNVIGRKLLQKSAGTGRAPGIGLAPEAGYLSVTSFNVEKNAG